MPPPSAPPLPVDVGHLEREAAAVLAAALDQAGLLHQPGARELYRQRLERALELSSTVVAAAAQPLH